MRSEEKKEEKENIVYTFVDKVLELANNMLKPKLGFDIDQRDNEIYVSIFIDEEFYVYVIVTWSNNIYHVEAMVGDENAVIQPKYFPRLKEVATFLEKVYELGKEMKIID